MQHWCYNFEFSAGFICLCMKRLYLAGTKSDENARWWHFKLSLVLFLYNSPSLTQASFQAYPVSWVSSILACCIHVRKSAIFAMFHHAVSSSVPSGAIENWRIVFFCQHFLPNHARISALLCQSGSVGYVDCLLHQWTTVCRVWYCSLTLKRRRERDWFGGQSTRHLG